MFTNCWRNSCIHTFSKGNSAMWNTMRHVQDLNSGYRDYFLQWQALWASLSCTHSHTHTHTHIYIYMCVCVVCVCVCGLHKPLYKITTDIHHHHHVAPQAWVSLTLSRHLSLSFIASSRSSRPYPVSSHSCWMYVRAGCPAFARPYVGVQRSTSLMSSSLLL